MIERLRERLRLLWQEDRYRADIKQFVEFGLGYFVVLVVGYLLLRKINLSLSESEMGKFSYVQSLVLIVAPVLYLAAPNAYLRFHEDHCISAKLRRFLMSFFVFASAALCGLIYWQTRSPFALLYAFYPYFMEKTYFLRAQMEVRKLNLLRTLELLLPLGAMYCLTGDGQANANAVLCFYGFGYMVSFAFGSRKAGSADFDRRAVVAYLLPLVLTGLLVVLVNNIAVVMAKNFIGYEAAGEMGVAVRSLLFFRSLAALFLMFYPMIYFREAKKGSFGVLRIYRATMIASAVLFTAFAVVFSPWVYVVLGAGEYLGSVRLFVILSISELINFSVDVYCTFFGLEIKTWKSTVVKGLSLVLLLAGFGIWYFMRPTGAVALELMAYVVLMASVVSGAAGITWALAGEKRYRQELRILKS